MENNNANKQADADMTLLDMEDAVGKAKAMVLFVADTLIMASDVPFEIRQEWFFELSFYARDIVDVLEPVRDSLAATRAVNN